MVGWVFRSEGIQKFLFPDALGLGDSQKLGIPVPQFSAAFLGVGEIVCGALLNGGARFKRLASIPLLIYILVAIATTKIPMLSKAGFWGMMHKAHTDFCVLLGLIFLLIVRFRYSVFR